MIFWVLLVENATRIKSLVYSKSRGRQGVGMVSEVVATRSRGCEKTVNLVGQGKLNSMQLIKRALNLNH